MPTFRRHRRLCASLALLALLAFALMPTVSRAMAFAGSAAGSWVEVCTPQGMKLVALDAGSESSAEPDGLQLDHCGFCALGSEAAAALPTATAAPLPTPGAGPLPPAFLHAPARLHAWLSAQPRAPPAGG